jgi:antitoxin (DNA-binding transcriptional repressor) of toxin-antitoxin stability system
MGEPWTLTAKLTPDVSMKSITIRDLRQRWPEAEAALKVEEEILITRDSKPVAKLVRVSAPAATRPRWDAQAHARWQKRVSRGNISRSDAALARSRAEREFKDTTD